MPPGGSPSPAACSPTGPADPDTRPRRSSTSGRGSSCPAWSTSTRTCRSCPNAGLGAGMDLLAWLERYIFPLERSFDVPTAERVAPAAWRAFAAAGTTTALVYGAVYEASLDATFRAAEAHGIRAIVGKVMMDRITYDPTIEPSTILDRTLAESARLIERWHGADDGRLRYAVTPRFAVSCTADLLRESAALAASTGAYWQTHVSEDQGEIAEVARLFPEAIDYVDVYDRAGGLGERTVLAHAVHLSDRELGRLVETGHAGRALPDLEPVPGVGRDAARPLPGRRAVARARVGCRGRSRPVDLQCHADRVLRAERAAGGGPRAAARSSGRSTGCGWARSAAPRCSGWAPSPGSLEAGKEADLIAVDPVVRGADPGHRGRRGGGPRQPAHLPRPSRHGPRGVGPRPPPGGSGRPGLTAGRRAHGPTRPSMADPARCRRRAGVATDLRWPADARGPLMGIRSSSQEHTTAVRDIREAGRWSLGTFGATIHRCRSCVDLAGSEEDDADPPGCRPAASAARASAR